MRLLPWQEELVAAVLRVDLSDGVEARVAACVAPPASALAAITTPDALAADPGGFVDAVLFPVLTLPVGARLRQTPLAYLLACFARAEAVAQVRGVPCSFEVVVLCHRFCANAGGCCHHTATGLCAQVAS